MNAGRERIELTASGRAALEESILDEQRQHDERVVDEQDADFCDACGALADTPIHLPDGRLVCGGCYLEERGEE